MCRVLSVFHRNCRSRLVKLALAVLERNIPTKSTEMCNVTGQISASKSSSSTASTRTIVYSMTSPDLSRIKQIYTSLDVSKCWRLSSGKIVEKVIERLALSVNMSSM